MLYVYTRVTRNVLCVNICICIIHIYVCIYALCVIHMQEEIHIYIYIYIYMYYNNSIYNVYTYIYILVYSDQASACFADYLGAFAPSPFCVFMSSSDRLSGLALEVWSGRYASVSFSFNVNNGCEKVKFVFDDVYVQSAVYRPALLSAISAVQVAMGSSIVTDKGHKSKSHKQAVIEFWIEQVPARSTNTSAYRVPIQNRSRLMQQIQ